MYVAVSLSFGDFFEFNSVAANESFYFVCLSKFVCKESGLPPCILESIAKRLYNAQQGNPLDMSCPLCLVVLLKLAIYRV